MNAVKGTKFTATFPVFSPGRSGSYIKDVKISGVITIDTCYSSDNNKHWIYFTCSASDDLAFYQIGKQYKKQGKNFYSRIEGYIYPDNYAQAAQTKLQAKQVLGLAF
jgi:hypothetical protein